MKRSLRFHRRALIRYWLALVAAGLIVGAAPKDDPAAKVLATSAVDQADDEKPKATDAVQQLVFSGPQPGEKIKPFNSTVLDLSLTYVQGCQCVTLLPMI